MIPTLSVIAVIALVVAATFYAYHEARSLRIRRIPLEFSNLPAAFNGYTVAFASDFHVVRFGRYERQIVEAMRRVRADLLALGGDYQGTHRKPVGGAKALLDALGALAGNFPDGIVAVHGNHDSLLTRQHLRRHPTIHYVNATALVVEREGMRIAIAGARKGPKRRRRMEQRVGQVTARIPAGVGFRILVAHWPEYFVPARRARFDLVLAGDTHGGQIRLPLVGALRRKADLPPRYVRGLLREGRTVLYTTSGIGTRYVPLRLFCPPEIVLFELRRGRAGTRHAPP